MVRTEWQQPQIWLRQIFTVSADEVGAYDLYLRVHHIEDAEVFLNGVSIARLPLSTTGYVELPVSDSDGTLLHIGENVLAVHAYQPSFAPPVGPLKQYIDVGLYGLERIEP